MEDQIFERIESLMRSQGVKTKEMLDYLELHRCTYDNWKAGKSKSYLKYIDKIIFWRKSSKDIFFWRYKSLVCAFCIIYNYM